VYCPAKTNRIVGWGNSDGGVRMVAWGVWMRAVGVKNGVKWALCGDREYLEGGGRGEGKEGGGGSDQ